MNKRIMISLSFIYILLFTACGNTGNTNVDDNSSTKSLKGIELYETNLKFVNGSRRYDIEKFDGITSALTPLYFDFDLQDFNLRNQDKEIFVDGQRNSLSNIEYKMNETGQLVASIAEKDIYSLTLLSSEELKNTKVKAYGSDIDVNGTAYSIEITYLSNFYIVDKLLSSEVFSSIDDFIEEYESKIFIGDYFRGLVFADEQRLKERKDGVYSDAGSYEVKILNNINMLMIYPDDSASYYADNGCYVLSFSRVWQSKCYLKSTKKEKVFYDKEAYDAFIVYLKNKLQLVEFTI